MHGALAERLRIYGLWDKTCWLDLNILGLWCGKVGVEVGWVIVQGGKLWVLPTLCWWVWLWLGRLFGGGELPRE